MLNNYNFFMPRKWTNNEVIDADSLNRIENKISENAEDITKVNVELENLKTDLSDCVGYRKFSGEWITAQHTLEDKTRNLTIEGDTKYVKDGVISDEWQESCELKSVGDLQGDGKYKIGLISSNYNLFNSFTNIKALDADNVVLKNNYLEATYKGNAWIIFKIATPRFKKNTTIIIRGKYTNEVEATGKIEIFQDLNKTGTMTACDIKKGEFVAKLNLKHDTDTLVISARNANGSSGKKVVFSKLIIEKDTDLNLGVEGNYDKKQILSQEPLHKISDTIKDTIVFTDGKWKIKRMCHVKNFDKNSPFNITGTNSKFAEFILDTDRYKSNADFKLKSNLFSDKVAIGSNSLKNPIGINATAHNALRLRPVDNDNLTNENVMDWFEDKTLEILYELETPFYEDIEQDISVYTYDKLTHIYVDTIIPPKLSFSNLVDLGSTINSLESSNADNLKLIEEQESKLEDQTHIILENDFRLCVLELGL